MKKHQLVNVEVAGIVMRFKRMNWKRLTDPDFVSICESYCPYSKYCEIFPDIRDLENEDKDFSDFCTHMIEEEYTNLSLVPIKGEIERALEILNNVNKEQTSNI